MVAAGQMPDQATAEAYETAVRELEMSPIGQAYVVARSNFEKLMAKVNQQISEGMEKGAASSIITLGMSRRGFFVVLEGPEGSGKSTLAGPLAERMRACGVDPVVVREPGGTRAAEIARQALLDPDHPVRPGRRAVLRISRPGPSWWRGHPAGAGSRAGGAVGPFRPVDRGLSDGGPGARPGDGGAGQPLRPPAGSCPT